MSFPRLPDWSLYAAVLASVLIASGARLQHADAPPSPEEGDLGPEPGLAGPGGPSVRVPAGLGAGPRAGTAFSVSEAGIWLTARHVVEGCDSVVVMTGPERGVSAQAVIDPESEAAVLLTRGAPAGLPLDGGPTPQPGLAAYHPGFPRGGAGEAASAYLGRETFIEAGRDHRSYRVLAWAETGHTLGLVGPLSGLSGAPALDGSGRVVGVTIGQSPRRGRIYTTTGAQMRHALALAQVGAQTGATGQGIDSANYGRVADDLRRSLQVAQVVCA